MSRGPRARSISLAVKIGALLAAATLLPLGAATFVEYRRARAEIERSTIALLQARTDELAGTIDGFHERLSRASRRVAGLPETVAFAAAAPADRAACEAGLKRVADLFRHTDPAVWAISVVAPDGTCTF